MEKVRLWNNYQFKDAGDAASKPIFIPFGAWPWSEYINQELTPAKGREIADRLNAEVGAGEPGIPIYQGHPDVPKLAAKYPDKAAIGWVKKITVKDTGLTLTVEWERWPGKGFAWFSPYWFGKERADGNKVMVTVDEIRSIGLVNRPNIKSFRLPNEELVDTKEKTKMNKDAIIALLGLPTEATEQEVLDAIGQLKTRAETAEANCQKCEAEKAALDDECKKKCATANACCGEAQKKLANEEAAHAETRKALENEKAEHEKLKTLKTESVTQGLENEAQKIDSRMGLVNEIMRRDNVNFEAAWATAKNQKPELFN